MAGTRAQFSGAGNFDGASMREAWKGPGMDTRSWLSYGIVDVPGEEQGTTAVEFDEDDGQLYVNVTLKPTDAPVRCRVGMMSAGSGEAVYFPFCGGEEVLVALPEGNPSAGCVIISRLNNFYDGFPFDSVGGADPKKNATALIRTRTPLTIESGASVQVRSAAAGALLLLDAKGGVTLRDGSANVLKLAADVFGYQNKAGDIVLQLELAGDHRFTMQNGQAAIVLCGAADAQNPQSLIQTPSTLAIGTNGLSITTAAEHVLTTEALFNILSNLLAQIAVASPGPLTGATLAAAYLVAAPAAIPLATLSPQLPAIGAALAAAFLNPAPVTTKTLPASVALGYQAQPSIGCAGLLSG